MKGGADSVRRREGEKQCFHGVKHTIIGMRVVPMDEGGEDMSRESLMQPVSLSILPGRCLNGIWKSIRTSSRESLSAMFLGRSAETVKHIADHYGQNVCDASSAIIDACADKGIRIIDYWSPGYPELLREIDASPLVLYCRGALHAARTLAIVGTRKSDPVSEEAARRLSRELSSRGLSIVSGMAMGIDRQAHQGALDAKGPTIGVLANGIDIVYPRANADIFRRIADSGNSCILSEYPPGVKGDKWTFVRRNRIISGLAMGTVVVKAGERSGALITARYALEQNRELFVCTGHCFDDGYRGCTELIRNGAVPVSRTSDIFRELNIPGPPDPQPDATDCVMRNISERDLPGFDVELEARVMKVLERGECGVDSITRELGSGASRINETLTCLEIAGLVERSGNHVRRR